MSTLKLVGLSGNITTSSKTGKPILIAFIGGEKHAPVALTQLERAVAQFELYSPQALRPAQAVE